MHRLSFDATCLVCLLVLAAIGGVATVIGYWVSDEAAA